MREIRAATVGERKVVGRVLATAFAEDPVIRWLRASPGRDFRLFRALATYVHAAPGSTDIAFEDGEPVGAGLWDPPGHRPSVRQSIAGQASLGLALLAGSGRGMRLESGFARHRPDGPLWYLAALGAVSPGRGVGSALLEHRLAEVEGPAYLESTNPANVPLYERFGFEVTEVFTLPAGGPPVWPMLRP